MKDCCTSSERGIQEGPQARVREYYAWLVPSTVLMFLPKCPACLAAYVAMWTGLGLPLSTAANLRWAMILLCAASLLFLSKKRLSRSTIT